MCEETRLYGREIKYFCVDSVECHTTSSDSAMFFSMYFSGSKICTWCIFVSISPSVGCLYFMKYVCTKIYWKNDLDQPLPHMHSKPLLIMKVTCRNIYKDVHRHKYRNKECES